MWNFINPFEPFSSFSRSLGVVLLLTVIISFAYDWRRRRYGVWKREENENCTKILRKSVLRKAIFTLLNENCIPRESTFQIKFIYMQNTDDVFGCFMKTPHRRREEKSRKKRAEPGQGFSFWQSAILLSIDSRAQAWALYLSFQRLYAEKRNNTESRGASMFPKSLTFSRKNSCIFYVL